MKLRKIKFFTFVLGIISILGMLSACKIVDAPTHTHVWEDATCTTSKKCKECGQVDGEPLGHHGGTATCQKKAICETCGLEYGEIGNHDWEAPTCTTPKTCKICKVTEGVVANHHGGTADCMHKAKCEVCQEEYGEIGDHDWEDATCTTPKTCKICKATEGVAIGHHGGVASCDHKAICEVCKQEYGELREHDWEDATCTTPKTCKVCKATEGVAIGHHGGVASCDHKAICEVCKQEYGELKDHDWEAATCTTPKTCKVCKATEGVALGHHGGTATCQKKAVCETCGLEYGEIGDHDWEDATCTTPKTCKVCKVTEGVAIDHHGGSADCSHKAICEDCGLAYGEFGDHVWEDATCTTPKTCKVCKVTEGVALGHHGGTATCQKKAVCETCGLEYGNYADHQYSEATCTTPKTCKVCKATEGAALGHHGGVAGCINQAICEVCKQEYGEYGEHDWEAATCTTPKTCKVCDETEGVALGHHGGVANCLNKAICEVCDQEYGELGDHVWKDITNGKQCEICNEVVMNGEFTGYYSSMTGHLDATFKQTLNTLISSNLKSSSYANVWTILKVADEDPNNSSNIICFYTGESIPKANQDGSSSASVVWNREHVWAKSHGFSDSTSNYAYYDCHHLHATEKNINATRGNLPFDDVTTGNSDGYGNSWSSVAFEPRDEVKGDVARSLFYMVVRYDDSTLDLELDDTLTLSSSKEPTLGKLSTLLRWAKEDPVSPEEVARNEVVYQYQGNRNPFIDHPEWIDLLYPSSSEPGPSDQPTLPTDITDKALITDSMVTIPYGAITATGVYKITTTSGTIEINWDGYDGTYASSQEFGIAGESSITFTMENETIYKLEADIYEYNSNIYNNMQLYKGSSSAGVLIDATTDQLGDKTGNKYTYIIDGGATELYYYNTYTKAVNFYNIYLYTKQDGEPIEPDVPPVTEGIVENIIYEDFQIHFLELGNEYTGDSTYIKAGDVDILIDAGSRKNSSVTIKEYVDQYCTDGKLEYVIGTHGDQDHIAGFVGNSSNGSKTGILYQYDIGTIITANYSNKTTQIYKDYLTAIEKCKTAGTKVFTAGDCYNNTGDAKRVFDLTNNISMEIIYNKYYFEKSTDENNYSVCTMFNYNDHHFMFTGDLELEGEQGLADYYDGSTAEKTLPHCDLFKGGHHGSRTSSNDCLLSKITPSICCVCCCAGSAEYTANYKTMFPTQEFIDRIAKYTDRVYITSLFNEETLTNESMNGNIIVSCNAQTIGLSASNNLTKLKDTTWFNETIYVVGENHCSGKGKTDFYTSATANAVPVVRRTWPNLE